MIQQLKNFTLVLCSFAMITAFSTSDSQAQVSKAFRITGSGIIPEGVPLPGEPPRAHWIEGNATHLGKHTGSGSVQIANADFSDFPNCITGNFGSGVPFEFVGANGNKLVCEYGRDENGEAVGFFKLTILEINLDGTLLVEADWLAQFVTRGDLSTGKFAGVSGSWTMNAKSEPFILGSTDPSAYSWEGGGRLTFKK